MSRGLNAFVEGKSALSPHDSTLRTSILDRSKGVESGQAELLDCLTIEAQSKNTRVIVSDGLDDRFPAVLVENGKACNKFSPTSGTIPTEDTTSSFRTAVTKSLPRYLITRPTHSIAKLIMQDVIMCMCVLYFSPARPGYGHMAAVFKTGS